MNDETIVLLEPKPVVPHCSTRTPVAINRSLGELYKLLARDEIAPRRAAVMAYTCSLLLRTLPALDRELHTSPQEDNTVVFDIDIDSAVARAAEAQRLTPAVASDLKPPVRS